MGCASRRTGPEEGEENVNEERPQRFSQPWIASASFDSFWIIAPAFLSVAWVMLFPSGGSETTMSWLLLIVGVDVAHVYSTVYKTYFDSDEFHRRKKLYTMAPLFGWLAGAMLYSIDSLFFWRAIAYLAVFHFIRQQYGWMRLYSRNEETHPLWMRRWDQLTIYSATLYPLLFWHTHQPRHFHWFIDGDFGSIPFPGLSGVGGLIYALILVVYLVKEIRIGVQERRCNLPKNLIMMGTALSWYVGIIILNGDLEFTITNVVSHGIPYMALIWWGGRQKRKLASDRAQPDVSPMGLFSAKAIPIWFGILVLLAYLEEGLWDGFVWRDHERVFSLFTALPRVHDEAILAWLVPLLALPQITHYILDGFIWRKGFRTEIDS